MYDLPQYKAADMHDVIAFMQAHPFVTLIAKGNTYPVATQVPVIFSERNGRIFLRAHIMKKTDHHLALEKDPHVLLLFTSAHTYVSASWYTNKQVGSTWNYKAVHAQGVLRFTDGEGLLDILTMLTETFENNPESPSLVKHLSEDYLNSMMKAIVGFEIEITNIEHVFKLSQNRDQQSFHNIIGELEKGDGGAREVAEEMKKLF